MEALVKEGLTFENYTGLFHPSQPNYLAFFSGSNQGVTGDSYPPTGSPYTGANLASQLLDASLTFKGYAEDLPSVGFTGSSAGGYVARHNAWVNFPSNVPASLSRPFSDFPSPDNYTSLPTVSIILPNLCHSGHSCDLSEADTFLTKVFPLESYLKWARSHNSLLILSFDEPYPDSPVSYPIYTLVAGANIPKNLTLCGTYNHYSLQRWLLELYQLPLYHDNLQAANPIATSLWNQPQLFAEYTSCKFPHGTGLAQPASNIAGMFFSFLGFLTVLAGILFVFIRFQV